MYAALVRLHIKYPWVVFSIWGCFMIIVGGSTSSAFFSLPPIPVSVNHIKSNLRFSSLRPFFEEKPSRRKPKKVHNRWNYPCRFSISLARCRQCPQASSLLAFSDLIKFICYHKMLLSTESQASASYMWVGRERQATWEGLWESKQNWAKSNFSCEFELIQTRSAIEIWDKRKKECWPCRPVSEVDFYLF